MIVREISFIKILNTVNFEDLYFKSDFIFPIWQIIFFVISSDFLKLKLGLKTPWSAELSTEKTIYVRTFILQLIQVYLFILEV